MDDDPAEWPDIHTLCIDLSKSKVEVGPNLEVLKEPSNTGEYCGDCGDGLTTQPEDPNLGEYVPQSLSKIPAEKKKRKRTKRRTIYSCQVSADSQDCVD